MFVCTSIESDCSLNLSQYLEKQKLKYQNQQGFEKYEKKRKRWWTPCFAIPIKNIGHYGDTHSITYVLLVL
jgi:hypothetical protein